MPHLELWSYLALYQWTVVGFLALLILTSSKVYPRLLSQLTQREWIKKMV